MKTMITIAAMIGCAVATSGCTATHLVYAQNSVLGIDVSVGTEGTEKLTFGFDRDTFTIVPKAEDVGTDGTRETDAMSLASASYVHVDGLSTIEFNHFVATGHAAKHVAGSRRAIEDAESLVEPTTTTTTTSTTTTTEAGALSRAVR